MSAFIWGYLLHKEGKPGTIKREVFVIHSLSSTGGLEESRDHTDSGIRRDDGSDFALGSTGVNLVCAHEVTQKLHLCKSGQNLAFWLKFALLLFVYLNQLMDQHFWISL